MTLLFEAKPLGYWTRWFLALFLRLSVQKNAIHWAKYHTSGLLYYGIGPGCLATYKTCKKRPQQLDWNRLRTGSNLLPTGWVWPRAKKPSSFIFFWPVRSVSRFSSSCFQKQFLMIVSRYPTLFFYGLSFKSSRISIYTWETRSLLKVTSVNFCLPFLR